MSLTPKKITLFFTIALMLCAMPLLMSKAHTSTAPQEGRRLALLVGINDYDRGTNPADKWSSLDTTKDLVNMRYVLETYYGFDRCNVRLLVNDEATQDNVVDTFTKHLISNAKPGDSVVFYYTGHGFHQPDTSGDEIADREDEVTVMWVPQDKQNRPANERRALMYMLDDKYQELVQKLSQKLRGEDGKVKGSITVIFDACNAGSGVKGVVPLTAKGRDWNDSIDGPRPAPFVPSDVASGWLSLRKDQFENVAFLAASQSDQFSYMMPNAAMDGSIFTYYLTQYLTNIARNKPHREVTYNDMLQSVGPKVRAMGRTQDPQIEGNVFAGILGDGRPLAFQSLPAVQRVRTGPLSLEIGMGSLHGISVGSRFDLFRRSTDVKNAANKLGELEITAVQSITAEGRVVNSSPGVRPVDFDAAQAVVTEEQFNAAPLKVLISSKPSPSSSPIPESRRKFLSAVVDAQQFISRSGVTEKFDVKLGWCLDDKDDICKNGKNKYFYQRASGKVVQLDATINAESLKKLLLAEWRWKRLADLSLTEPPKVHIDMVRNNGDPWPRSAGGHIILRRGDEGKVTVTNNTGAPVFITLLYLKDSGDILVFPGPDEVNGQQPLTADNKPIDLFRLENIKSDHKEFEILKIIATPRAADFTGVGMSAEQRKGIKTKGPKNPLEELLFGIIDGTPKSLTLKPIEIDLWYIAQVAYEIHPN